MLDRDLFADQDEWGIWFEDADLLAKLAMDKLRAAADELATRWKWSEARIEASWSDLARFGRVHPTPGETADEEKAECERLHVRHDELVNMDDDEWTEALAEEAEAIEARLAAIEVAVEARAVFRPEDIAVSGCIVGHPFLPAPAGGRVAGPTGDRFAGGLRPGSGYSDLARFERFALSRIKFMQNSRYHRRNGHYCHKQLTTLATAILCGPPGKSAGQHAGVRGLRRPAALGRRQADGKSGDVETAMSVSSTFGAADLDAMERTR